MTDVVFERFSNAVIVYLDREFDTDLEAMKEAYRQIKMEVIRFESRYR